MKIPALFFGVLSSPIPSRQVTNIKKFVNHINIELSSLRYIKRDGI